MAKISRLVNDGSHFGENEIVKQLTVLFRKACNVKTAVYCDIVRIHFDHRLGLLLQRELLVKHKEAIPIMKPDNA